MTRHSAALAAAATAAATVTAAAAAAAPVDACPGAPAPVAAAPQAAQARVDGEDELLLEDRLDNIEDMLALLRGRVDELNATVVRAMSYPPRSLMDTMKRASIVVYALALLLYGPAMRSIMANTASCMAFVTTFIMVISELSPTEEKPHRGNTLRAVLQGMIKGGLLLLCPITWPSFGGGVMLVVIVLWMWPRPSVRQG